MAEESWPPKDLPVHKLNTDYVIRHKTLWITVCPWCHMQMPPRTHGERTTCPHCGLRMVCYGNSLYHEERPRPQPQPSQGYDPDAAEERHLDETWEGVETLRRERDETQAERDRLKTAYGQALTARSKALTRLQAYDERLTAVMPPDFKDWHDNSPDEWPEVAARVIESLREREEQAWQAADAAIAEQDLLARQRDEAFGDRERMRKDVDGYWARGNRAFEQRNKAMRERDKAQAQVQALRTVLEDCRHAISFAPEDAFGYVLDEETGEPKWPVRNELMQRAADALADLNEEDDGE